MKFCVAIFVLFSVIIQMTQSEEISREQWTNYRRTCFNILRTSPEVRDRMNVLQFDEDNAEVHCVVRCAGILSGIFDDETGNNLDVALAQAEGKPGFDEFKAELEQCVAGVTPEQYGEDYCKKGFLYFKCSKTAYKKHILKKD